MPIFCASAQKNDFLAMDPLIATLQISKQSFLHGKFLRFIDPRIFNFKCFRKSFDSENFHELYGHQRTLIIYRFKSMISITEMPFITSIFGMLLALSQV